MDCTELMNTGQPGRQAAARAFRWRALVSVLLGLAFVLLLVSGAVLAISPPGRVANWTDWRLLGLRKHDWADLHTWFGLALVVAGLFHLVLNWRPLRGYFRGRSAGWFGLRGEWLVAGILAAAIFAGTLLGVPPFSSLLELAENVKGRWEKRAEAAPIPHAELLTVGELAQQAGVELATALERLAARGVAGAAAEVRVAELAERNRLSAQRVYQVITGGQGGGQGRGGRGGGGEGHGGQVDGGEHGGQGHGMGGGGRGGGGGGGGEGGGIGGGGFGRLTVEAFCAREGIDVQAARQRLEAEGIELAADETLREIAERNGDAGPQEVMRIIRAAGPE